MGSQIQISSPLLKGLIHSDTTADVATSTILTAPPIGTKRIIVIVQNKSANNIFVIFSSTGDNGILVQPNQLISMDNYCGDVRVNASANGSPIHIAYGQV